MNYFVLIADIIESKRIVDRHEFQEKFKEAIAELNTQWRTQMVSPYTITLGDEFQGVLKRTEQLFGIIHTLQAQFPEQQFRFAMSTGTIETQINPDSAIGMDGPVFHHARRAMEIAKTEQRHLKFYADRPEADLIDQLLAWIDLTSVRWKNERLKIIALYHAGLNQKQMAEQLPMTQPAISQNLNSPGIREIIKTEKLLENHFNRILAE